MANDYAPGIIHEDAFSQNGPIAADNSSVAAFLGKTVWGPINDPTPVQSFSDYLRLFGGYAADSDMAYAVRGFFQNGGGKAYINRLANYSNITAGTLSGALQATLAITDKTSADNILDISAKSGGVYGNSIEVALTNAALSTTTLNGVTAAGAASFKVDSPQGIYVGQVLEINAVEWVEVSAITTSIVAGVPEHTVSIVGVTLTASHADGVVVKSLEFDIEVYYEAGSTPVEVWPQLSLTQGADNYLLDVVNADSGGSKYISVAIDATNTLLLAGTPNVTNSYYPVFSTRTTLAGGTSVGTITASDVIGSPVSATGFEALNSVDEVRLIAVISDSGQVSYEAAVNHAGLAYCENRTDCFYFCSSDHDGDSGTAGDPTGAIAERKADGYNSTFGAIFYNRVQVFDPEGTGSAPNRYVDNLGHILGATARVDTATPTSGPWNAAAGARGELKGVIGVERKVGGIDVQNLNDAGVNVIRSVGTLGVMIMGARTLANEQESTFKFINVPRALIFLQQSISNSLIWAAFRNNNSTLWREVKNEINDFLNGILAVEGLRGDTPADAYSVLVGEDDGVQDANDTLNGRVISEIAVKFQRPAESIIFRWSEKTN